MTMRVADDVKDAALDAVVDEVDSGTTNAAGKIEFYTGSRPATLDGTPAGTLLVSVDYQDPAFGAAYQGEASALGVPLSTTGLNDGTIGFARVLDKDETPLWDDDDVGTNSSNNITVNTLSVSTGVDFELTSHTVTMSDETA